MPCDGASETRTLRGITVSYTFSPKWPRTSAATRSHRLLRRSYIVSSTPVQREARVERLLHALDRADQLRQPFERIEFALQRHQHAVGGDQRVDRQQVQGRRAVDQHLDRSRPSGCAPPCATGIRAAAVPLNSISAPARSGEAGTSDRRGTAVAIAAASQIGIAEQQLVAGDLAPVAADAEPGAGIALRVEIDDQDAIAGSGQRGRQIDRGRRLADPAFLIGDRDDARPARAPARTRVPPPQPVEAHRAAPGSSIG